MFEKYMFIDEITDTSGKTHYPDQECFIVCDYETEGSEVCAPLWCSVSWGDTEIEACCDGLIDYEELEEDARNRAIYQAELYADMARGH